MQPTTGNDELAGGRGQDPKGEPAGERREDGQQKRHVPSPGAEKGGSSKVCLAVATTGWPLFCFCPEKSLVEHCCAY